MRPTARSADQAGSQRRDVLQRLLSFIGSEIRPYPGRYNVTLRCMLASAIVIVTSMALQVPLLALSLIVVFYVTQANVVLTRLIGVLFAIGSTLAIACAIVVLKFTYDYPLLRILLASGIFFCSVYLMRVTKIGVVFFLVALVVIYVQTFVDQTDQAELLIRTVLWVWVAVNYAIALTLIINTLFLPAEPSRQLSTAMCGQLGVIDTSLAALEYGKPITFLPSAMDVQLGILTLQKLLRFASMRDKNYLNTQASQFACVTAVSRLYAALRNLPESLDPSHAPYVAAVRRACSDLSAAIRAGATYVPEQGLQDLNDLAVPGALIEMRRALVSFGNRSKAPGVSASQQSKKSLFVDDAWTNPVYTQFTLKTLLAVLLSYVFYIATDWPGIHTVMLSCLIVAQPSLGATSQRAILRMGGAMVGSLLALAAVIWIVPRIDGIVGLLLMTLPVIALGAWVSAGSERISYAGVQIMFTFALALLEQFGPETNLTEIRDRMVGIVLGVAVSAVIQGGLWPEAEGESLRQKVARLLKDISTRIRPGVSAGPAPISSWSELGDCEAMSARVALEPGWQVGEGQQERFYVRVQTVLAQTRELLFAMDALEAERLSIKISGPAAEHVEEIQDSLGTSLHQYADALTKQSSAIAAPSTTRATALADGLASSMQPPLSDISRHTYAEFFARIKNLIDQVSSLPAWDTSSINDIAHPRTLRA